MDRFSVVIAGGGVAAIEGLLRLRRLAGDAVNITLLAPNDEFFFRALSVKEPFALGGAERHEIRHIVRDSGAEWVKDTLAWVDPDGQVVHTGDGAELGYDALLVAIGARLEPVYEHATTFRDAEADALLTGLVEDIEGGYSKSVAFIAPEGPIYELPLYELALMTASRSREMGMEDADVTVTTPDAAPLSVFGSAVSEAVGGLLADAGIAVRSGTVAKIPAANRVELTPGGGELTPDRIVALPRVVGPGIRGLPGVGAHGFIPVDAHCAVPGAGGRIFAAGDATDFAVKHGGIGSQQADTAAAAIAHLAGIEVGESPFQPVIRGMLLTGGAAEEINSYLDRG
jgi:sulfide:quinone oxidoreductase